MRELLLRLCWMLKNSNTNVCEYDVQVIAWFGSFTQSQRNKSHWEWVKYRRLANEWCVECELGNKWDIFALWRLHITTVLVVVGVSFGCNRCWWFKVAVVLSLVTASAPGSHVAVYKRQSDWQSDSMWWQATKDSTITAATAPSSLGLALDLVCERTIWLGCH